MSTSSNPKTVEISPLLPASALDSAAMISSSNPKTMDLSTILSALLLPSASAESVDLSAILSQLFSRSNPEIMDQRLYLESELYKPNPGMWQVQRDPDLCCIYRVPDCLRQVNPEAYTPQLVLVGPLHHSLKSEALKCLGDIKNTKAMNYLNMERHKKIYLAHFARRRVGRGEKEVIDEFKKIIKEEEGMLRASYSESTAWISSSDFIEMIMLDCVFIIELLIKWFILDMVPNINSSHGQDISSTNVAYNSSHKTGDPLLDDRTILHLLQRDLTMLENQIPYYIFEKLYGVCIKSSSDQHLSSFRVLADKLISRSAQEIKDNTQFKHFTDMVRCVHVGTLPEHFLKDFKADENDVMYHADKLHSGGVKFKAVDSKHSLNVKFKKGFLHIPCFSVDESTEETLRNIIALEQCHYSYNSHVSNYITFLDNLIDTQKDVALLVEKGIIRNMLGDHSEVATMVNRLCVGVNVRGSHYSVIANGVQKHYNNPWNKSSVILKTVYFSNLWRGTATIAAIFLLLLTLTQTVFSILQFLSP